MSRFCSTATPLPSRMPISAFASVSHSPDHRPIAYAVDIRGSELYTVNIIEAATGTLLDSTITDNNGALEWANHSGRSLYLGH